MKQTKTILGLICSLTFSINVQASSPKNSTSVNNKALITQKSTLKQTLKYAPNQLIVRFKKDQSINTLRYQAKIMIQNNRSLGKMSNGEQLTVVKIQKNVDIQTAMAMYKADPNVKAVSYDYYNELYFSPNDTSYVGPPNVMWGLHDTAPDLTPFLPAGRPAPANSADKTVRNDIDAQRAWDIWKQLSPTAKSNVVVAVIDTGVDYTHPDLVDAMWDGSKAMVAGALSPTKYFGRNVADNNNDPYPINSEHGTHVAGTIAATGNNNIGIPGVAYGVKIMAIKVTSNVDGFILDSSLISGINYAVENGADIINLSLGQGGSENPVLTTVVKNAVNAGVLLVVAAGNNASNNDANNQWPANYANQPLTQAGVISVAATDQADLIANFSNFGANNVSIAAPGVNIKSTITGIETKPENFEKGLNLPLGSGSGVSPYPFCSNDANQCFKNTIFSNPVGSDCTGTKCRWGWGRSNSQLNPEFLVVADDNIVNNTSYENSVNGTITSKIINTANKKAILRYQAYWDLECGNGNADYVDIEVYNGSNWILLTGKSLFNLNDQVILNGNLNPCNSSHTITGRMAKFPANPAIGFITMTHDISAYSNANLRVRFRFVTNSTINSTAVAYGFQMKNLRIITQRADYTDSYAYFSGTSMASPHVAGIAALIKAVNPTYTNAQIKTTLVNAGDDNASLAGKISSGKRANAYNAIRQAVTPQPPSLAQIGNKSVSVGQTLSFTISATDLNGTIPLLEISGKPTNALFTLANQNTANATFSWTPIDADIGSTAITFTAKDSDASTPGSNSERIVISVAAASIGGNSTSSSGVTGGGGSSGGCTLHDTAKFDPLLPSLLFFLSIFYLFRQNTNNIFKARKSM